MKTVRILALALIVLCLALVFASCGGGSGGSSGGADGTYYLYENGQTKSGDWIKLDGKNWEADDDTAGRYEQKGSTLIFYADVFGEEEEVWSGTLSNGKLTIEFLGETFVYYKKGMAPTSGGSSSTDKGNTPAPTSSVTYQITYDANGGAFADGKTTLTVTEQENAPLTAPDSPARDNYTFGGWAKQKKGSDLVDFSTDKATGNITLYATWKEKSASVLSVDGATIDGNSIFLYVDRNVESVSLSSKVVCSSDSVWKLYYDKMGQVEIPTKIAAGMVGELDDGNNVFYIVVTSNDGTQVNVYDLTVHRSYRTSVRYYDGTNLLKTDSVYTGTTYSLDYHPQITGYTFNRWLTKTGAAADASLTVWEEQSFYVGKTAKTYTVTLDVNGGNPLSQTTKTVTYDAAYSLGRPTRIGHSFAGWTVGGTLVTDANGTALAAWTYDGNRTLRAAWTANTYQVSLYRSANEGGSVSGEGGYTYGQSVTVSAETNNGYTWLGWYDQNGNRLTDKTNYTFTMGLNTSIWAKWTYYTLTTATNDANAGSYSGYSATKVTAGRSVIISASTRNGYTWLGWYNGDVKLTDNLSYTFTMPTENVTYTAKWEINTYSITYDLGGGTLEPNPNPTAYTVQNNTITITGTPTRTGYTFTGWSVSSIPKGSTGDKTVTANWTPTVYSITYNLNGGSNAASNPNSYTILTAENGIALADPSKAISAIVTDYEPLENDNYSATIETTAYTFLGWYIESTFEHEITTIVFTDSAVQLYAKWGESVTSLTVTTAKSTYIRDGDYVYFGEYPQTIKADDVEITDTVDARGYYLGSDGAYYAKVTASPYGSGKTFSTGATMTSGVIYYFKVEPIKWRILSESDGDALILCDSIIANQKYYKDENIRTINGATVYPNNYMYSDIRAWLNKQFYETAFTELQRELILTTTVDNSARSTNQYNNAEQWGMGSNKYACADTQDKIFLLSEQEVTNSAYGFNASYSYTDTARQKVTSDYSRATGASMNTSAEYFGNGSWWLRSPSVSYKQLDYFARTARSSGSADDYGVWSSSAYGMAVHYTYYGVVPALTIQLN